MVLLCNLCCPGTQYIAQYNLNLKVILLLPLLFDTGLIGASHQHAAQSALKVTVTLLLTERQMSVTTIIVERLDMCFEYNKYASYNIKSYGHVYYEL